MSCLALVQMMMVMSKGIANNEATYLYVGARRDDGNKMNEAYLQPPEPALFALSRYFVLSSRSCRLGLVFCL